MKNIIRLGLFGGVRRREPRRTKWHFAIKSVCILPAIPDFNSAHGLKRTAVLTKFFYLRVAIYCAKRGPRIDSRNRRNRRYNNDLVF
jgi:hypothetical protein